MKKLVNLNLLAMIILTGGILCTGCNRLPKDDIKENAAIENEKNPEDVEKNSDEEFKEESYIVENGNLPEDGKYEIKNKKDCVEVIVNVGGVLTTTRYNYDGDKIKDVVIVQEYPRSDVALGTYRQLKEDSSIGDSYTDIEYDDKIISMRLNEQTIKTFQMFTKDELYEIQKQSYSNYGANAE